MNDGLSMPKGNGRALIREKGTFNASKVAVSGGGNSHLARFD